MRFVLLLALLFLMPQGVRAADPIIAQCPSEWSFGGRTLPLVWANTWADDQAIDNDYDDAEETPGRAIGRIDMSKVQERPLFFYCRYQNMYEYKLAISIPEGAKTCMIEWKGSKWDTAEKVNRHYDRTLRAQCRGNVQGEASRVYPAETPSLTSDIHGLHLRRRADELKRNVLAQGGTWAQLGEGMPADITLGDSKLRVVFSLSTGLSRKIVLYGPNWSPGDPAFYTAIIQRFGFPDNPYGPHCLRVWNAYGQNDDTQVEWYRPCDKTSASAAQEMRLVDWADPDSQKERQ